MPTGLRGLHATTGKNSCAHYGSSHAPCGRNRPHCRRRPRLFRQSQIPGNGRPGSPPAGHQRGQGARSRPRAQPARDTTGAPQVRLGILATPADTTGLAALRLGYIAARLAPSGVQLVITAYTSPAAQADALQDGSIDAAYTTPAAAATAWEHNHGIRIIAGATSTAAGAPAIVLATAAGFLTSRPADVTAILQGDIQATVQLTTAPATALPGARAELLTLLRHPLTRHAAAALARYHATTSPGTAVTGALLDMTPVNTLLKASGLPPAS
jgi:hypothetical protein